jgi:O-antigen/teichoic acid export membrane protein
MVRVITLTERTAWALSFRLFGSVLDVGLSVALGVVLARILSPAEFGLFGVAFSIVAIAEMLSSCGMLRALVQRKDLAPEHESAAAIFQLSGAFLLSTVLFFSAPIASTWFKMPGLAVILRLLPVLLIIEALTLLPEARLTRRLAFDRLTLIQACSRAFGGGLAIFVATRGWGALSLVIGSISTALVRMALLWVCAPGFVPIGFQKRHFRPLFSFGSAVLIINVVNQLAQRVDVLIIGRLVGTGGVGLYQRAVQLGLLPLTQLTSPVNKVLFSSMSSIQDEPVRFRRGYLATVRFSAFITFPVLTGLWATADIVVPFIYGPMWEGAVPLLQILAIAGFFRVLANTQGLVAQAHGRASSEARRQLLWLVLVLLFGTTGSTAGVLGVAIGVCLATFIFFASMTHLALPLAGVTFNDWLSALRTGVVGCVFMGFAILLVKSVFVGRLPTIFLLVAIAGGGLSVYVAIIRFCLSTEDAKFAELVSGILPTRVGMLLRSFLGINRPILVKGASENIPA